jgi:hypothetical protein
MAASVALELSGQLEQLAPENQKRLLAFAQRLVLIQSGHPAANLLPYSDQIPEDLIDEMEHANEEAHEQIDGATNQQKS